MKTTVDIDDALLEEAKRLAARARTTLRALIEEGLRRVVNERRKAKEDDSMPSTTHPPLQYPSIGVDSARRD